MKKTSSFFVQDQIATDIALEISPDLQVDENTLSVPISLFVEAVEQSPIAISITDKKANILYVNAAFFDVTGYSAIEILGKNESELSDKCTPREIYQGLWRTISRKEIWQGHLVNRKKLGDRYLADVTIAPIMNHDGAITHYIGMHRDVTVIHQTQQQVSNQKKLIESVLNASPVAMIVLDESRHVVLCNKRYQDLMNEFEPDENQQEAVALFFVQTLEKELGDLWAQKDGFSQCEIRVDSIEQRGTKWFSCCGNWFNEEDTQADNFFSKQSHNYLLLSINDKSLQHQHYENMQLQTLRLMIAEEEYLRSIRETLLGAMHQIRLPLNQINAAVQIMATRNDHQNQPLKALLNQVQEKGEETLVTLQRCVPEIPESAVMSVNFNQLIHEAIRLFSHHFLASSIVIDWQPNLRLPAIMGSENKLRMLFKQLFDNAVNAMNRASSHERMIKIRTTVEGGWLCVRIADTGPGIPANQRNRVFEPFFSTQNKGQVQTGMGLVMAREIVNQHNGMIEIDTEYSEGCCINLRFPLIIPRSLS